MTMAFSSGVGIPTIDASASHLAPDKALLRIATGSIFFFVATFFGLGLNYVYSIVLARVVGPEQFGMYALGLGCFNLLSVVAVAGLDTAVLRFIPTLRTRRDAGGVKATLRAALVLAAVLGTFFGFGLLLCADGLANDFFHDARVAIVLRFSALSIPLFVVSTVALAALQAFREVRWRASVKYLYEPFAKAAVTAGLIGLGWGLTAALVALPIALVLTTALALLPLRQILSYPNNEPRVHSGFGTVFRYSLPLLSGLAFVGLATRSDILLLGHWSSVEFAGVYSAAFQTAAMLALILGTLESIATPFLSEGAATNDPNLIRPLAATMVRWSVTGTLPVGIVMVVFAHDIMRLFGARFESGAVCLMTLALGQLLYSAAGCSNGLLLWAGRSRLVMWNGILVSTLQIVLYLALIPPLGIVGAAVATCASLVVTAVVRTIQVQRVLNVWPYDLSLYKPLLAGAVASSIVLTVKASVPSHVDILIGLLVLVYVGLLWALGLHDEDRAVLANLKRRCGARDGTNT